MLLRKYGSTFKYFIGAELGEGKGSRGLENNPHYHVIFFVESANSPRFPYKKITEREMTHLVRKYWQGFDEETDGFRDYQTAKYGMVGVSDEGATIKDFRAEKYCGKYVCKDIRLKRYEKRLVQDWKMYFSTHVDYIDIARKLMEAAGDTYEQITLLPGLIVDDIIPPRKYFLEAHQKEYEDSWIADQVRLKLNEFRNRYSNKVRASQGLGLYALNFILDKLEPRIIIPDKDGVKTCPIGMYFYRKLYTKVVQDPQGHNLYILNDLGRQYKLHNLPIQLERLSNRAQANLSLLTEDLYNKMLASDINTDITTSFDRIQQDIQSFNNNKIIADNYANYKLIYEDRYFKLDETYNPATEDYTCSFPDLDPYRDYSRFIEPAYYHCAYRPNRLTNFLANDNKSYLPFHSHPVFLPMLRLFAVLDLLADYLAVQKDDKRQNEAEERAETRKFFTRKRIAERINRYSVKIVKKDDLSLPF